MTAPMQWKLPGTPIPREQLVDCGHPTGRTVPTFCPQSAHSYRHLQWSRVMNFRC